MSHFIEMVVLQATPFCNLDCTYCYLPDRSNRYTLPINTIKVGLQKIFKSKFVKNHLTVLWHAGEPLVVGLAYYRDAFAAIDAIKPADLEITHSIQTNGTLINAEWLAFFREQRVRLGVSVDGPAELHDANRVTRSKRGSFEQVMRGVRLLAETGYPFHVITVLTKASIVDPARLLDFYVSEGIRQVAFNVEEIEGEHKSSTLTKQSYAEMKAFYATLVRLARERKAQIRFREVVGAYSSISNPSASAYGNPLAEPLRMLTITTDGSVSSFAPELVGHGKQFLFGNILTDDLDDIVARDGFLSVSAEIARGVALCKASCEYFDLCGGGSPANKWFENGTFESTETLFCRLSKKAVIDVVLEELEAELGRGMQPIA